MDESILTSIKKLLGIEEDYDHFDQDIIMNINSAFMNLMQLGVGVNDGFMVTSHVETWADFIGDRKDLAGIKIYTYLKTRLVFDPPQMGYLVDAIKKQIEELEWRLNVQVETLVLGQVDTESGNDNGSYFIDYNDLINRPKIENVTLEGNKKLKEIGVVETSNEEISSLFK